MPHLLPIRFEAPQLQIANAAASQWYIPLQSQKLLEHLAGPADSTFKRSKGKIAKIVSLAAA